MKNIRQSLGKINITGSIGYEEPMAAHTSFKVGGPADFYIVPAGVEDIIKIRRFGAENCLPVFPVGSGANILVSDAGIRGIVMDMAELKTIEVTDTTLEAGAGAGMSDTATAAINAGLAGLEFIYAMPGSVGGSVWMNARCHGISISDVLSYVDILDEKNELIRTSVNSKEFSYKLSPYMGKNQVIIGAGFHLAPGGTAALWEIAESHRIDREKKGHFAAPCAGSVFKNNRAFGAPTGKIIDDLNLKGVKIGGAKISDLHGNIIINDGNATAGDILALIEHVEKTVFEVHGFRLEREVMPIGRW